MRCRISLLASAALMASAAAMAQTPPVQPQYQINLGPSVGLPFQFVPGDVPMWVDTTNTTINPWGLPTPVSVAKPFPVQVVSGGGGGGGTSSTVSVSNFPATQPVSGSVSVSNFPATQPVSGSLGVTSLPALPTGSNAIGSVSVSNLPATQPVSAASLPLPAGAATSANQAALNGDGGSLAHVTNFPATQPVSGTVGVSSLPALPTGSNAIGSVSVSNLPATQPVSGSVSVSNLPATQPVSGTVAVSTLPALPAGANAIGSVSVSNLPATQPVSGTVSVGNFPATQPVADVGSATTDGSTTVTTGGTAQNLFGGTAAVNGFEVCNPGATDDLWISDSTTAAANATGTFRVAVNGGCYVTPVGRKPLGAISVYGATTGDPITARRW